MAAASNAEGNVGVALGLVCGAGAATAIGASVVFFPRLVKLASRRVLAASLGLSAGVMIYVSFVEIFMKSVDEFALHLGVDEEGISDDEAEKRANMGYIYATLSFFGGIVIMLIVDVIVRCLSGEYRHHDIIDKPTKQNNKQNNLETSSQGNNDDEQEAVAPHCVGCATDPVAELNEWQQRADEEIQGRAVGDNNTSLGTPFDDDSGSGGTAPKGDNTDNVSDGNNSAGNDSFKDNQLSKIEENENKLVVDNTPSDADAKKAHDQKKLVKMGLSTAVAIAIHNFPEGLATFVAALDDPSVGAVLAIAIGIHNIPEGLCVALPIYYATGNRWKAFMWGCLSGLSEPVAALLGWAVLAKAVTQDVYAILFGLVSGMMVIISLKELIPTAHRYDPEDTVVTYSLIGGMVIIALSLVLFKL